MSDIVTFGIPLISRAAARDWTQIETLFNATLASLYNQTDQNFRIIVASNGRPALRVPVDERLEFIDHPRSIPQDYIAGNIDAGNKRWEIAMRHVELGGGNLVFVDADDLISARLVEFVRRTNDPNGCIITDGYVMNWSTGALAPFPLSFMKPGSFHAICASCAAMNISRSDLYDKGADGKTRYQRIYGMGHHLMYDAMVAEGRPPAAVPFPAAVYVLFTGQNGSHSASNSNAGRDAFRDKVQHHMALEGVEITEALRSEFALPSVRDRVAPRLSVAVSTYKRPEGLKRLLATLRPQIAGRSQRELIVVNDGSHDADYADVIAEFKDIVRYEPLPANVGIAKARNAAAGLARGDFVVFTDDDCEAPDWWLDWLEARLDANPELDVVAGTTRPLFSKKPSFMERIFAHYHFIPRPWSTGRATLFVTANAAIRRDLFWQHGGFGFGEEFPGAGEDSELANRLSRAGARMSADFDWYVLHTVSDTLRQQMRRFWRYGYANVWMTRLTTVPESYISLASSHRRRHWQNARAQYRRNLALSDGFAESKFVRRASAAVAALIWAAYYDGCAVAAAEKRAGR